MRARVKALAESVLSGGPPAWLARRRVRGRALVLAYHGIVPDGAAVVGDRSLHLPQRAFAAQLDELARTCRVVPLEALLGDDGQPPASADDLPRVAITFDDAYHGTLTAGCEELARRGLPATMFVTPAFLGGGTFWWDALEALDRPGVRDEALWRHHGRTERVRVWAEAEGLGWRTVPAHATAVAESLLHEAAARTPGLTLASHTWSHPNLSALDPAELDEELRRPLAWLRERLPGVRPWISYPYGLASSAVESAAARAGYTAAFRVDGGWWPRDGGANRFALPRLNIPAGLSPRGFTLRLLGMQAR